jgi:hypothetical protein
MNTSVKSPPKWRRAYVPRTALAKEITFDEATMSVFLTDGRTIMVPLIWFPGLHEASSQERQQYEIGGGGVSLHWAELDEDISMAHLMAGVDWQAA